MQYEAVIIGAGIMGLCTAYYLNQGGMKRILVVDREPYFGGYNTTRCAGGLRYQFADEMNIRLSQLSWSLMQETGQKAGISFQLNRCGYAFFITDRQREQSYLEAYHLQKALGVEVSLFQGEEFAQREPRLQYEGVRFITFGAEEGILDVHQVVSFLTDNMRGFRSCAARALPAYKEKGAVLFYRQNTGIHSILPVWSTLPVHGVAIYHAWLGLTCQLRGLFSRFL